MSIPPSSSSPSLTALCNPDCDCSPGSRPRPRRSSAVLAAAAAVPLQATIIPIHLVGGSCPAVAAAAAAAAAQLKNCDNREQTNERTAVAVGSAENELRRVTSHINREGKPEVVVSKAEGKEAEAETDRTPRRSVGGRRTGGRTVIQTQAKDRRRKRRLRGSERTWPRTDQTERNGGITVEGNLEAHVL